MDDPSRPPQSQPPPDRRDGSRPGDDGRPGNRRPGARPDHAPDGEGRRRRDRRGAFGFADGIERAFCSARQVAIAPAYPVQHRHGVATRKVDIAARREGALLLCDLSHEGPCVWPDGEAVGEG
ncbi:MAG: hypothetical protein AVDCRST_MAG73-1015 [uncultured Thermomicrobiales bacterium]|uniref:Uncharacterized protein n=1 Tax=uncultured Thermomicrobiales bacterium TaxID=1645740 RepID=A0A6J4TU67_9BACT|nr:MAG: hypothetical protein AVDCRST_MAG73-1015 [uncultured Thermomicrobiales bacterium]